MLVSRLAPELEIETADSFDEARQALCTHPPQGLIVNLTPSPLPWGDLLQSCREQDPPIPVLFESCVYRSPQEAGIDGLCELGSFLAKPYSLDELRRQIQWLVQSSSVVRPQGAV